MEDSGVELNVLLGKDGAVQQEKDPLGGDADPLHQLWHCVLYGVLQVSLQLHQFLWRFWGNVYKGSAMR